MEKEPESIATVQMKQDYAASEVYSTAGSEGPPAYVRRQSSSVQIAKIIALTVIAASFILGSFILASSYLQARASCDQMQTLDAVLEKELMLETLQQELPKAEALLQARENSDNNLQSLDKESVQSVKKDEKKMNEKPVVDNSSETDAESDSSFSDSDESADLNRVHLRLPLELDLGDLANALLENNQKSRMNCVVERRKAEELVDTPPKTMQLPFGLNLTTDPKKKRVTGERLAIFCESGSEPRNPDAEQLHPFLIPIQRYPIPYGPMPQQGFGPITHMPQQMMPPPQQQMTPPQRQESLPQPPQFIMRQIPQFLQQQQQQQPQILRQMPPPSMHQMPPVPDQIMQAPRSEQQQLPQPEIRIQLQRIPIPMRGEMTAEPVQIREMTAEPVQIREIPIAIHNAEMQQPHQVQVQRIPLAVALERAGITQEDLKNIRQMAEEHIQQELRHLTEDNSNNNMGSGDASDSGSDEDDSQQHADDTEQHHIPPPPPQILQMGRAAYGRSLVQPIRIPVNMMQSEGPADNPQPDRPHFVQPRSVRSVDAHLDSEQRVKRYTCDCKC